MMISWKEASQNRLLVELNGEKIFSLDDRIISSSNNNGSVQQLAAILENWGVTSLETSQTT